MLAANRSGDAVTAIRKTNRGLTGPARSGRDPAVQGTPRRSRVRVAAPNLILSALVAVYLILACGN